MLFQVFVLDEADVMISETGHHDQSIRLHRRLSPSCQMMLFSATYDERIMEFADMIIPEPCIKVGHFSLFKSYIFEANINYWKKHLSKFEEILNYTR